MAQSKRSIVCWLLFLGLTLTYAALSPGGIARMGYMGEEMQAGNSLLDAGKCLLTGARPISPVVWSRHGPVPVLFDLPFLYLGQYVVSQDFMLAFLPVLSTATVITLLFAWLLDLTSPRRAFLVALGGAFGTMLWPFAYIGLETTQSLFLVLAGYRALARGPSNSWTAAVILGICCGLTVGVKSTGIVLLPAVIWLIYAQYRDRWRHQIPKILVALAVTGLIWFLGEWGRAPFWGMRGGSASNIAPWLIDSFFSYFSNLIGWFGSPNKGLFVFAPPLLVAIYAVPKVWQTHRHLAIFVVLAVGGLAAGFAFLRGPADEVWGPRYLHSAIAPLLLCIGASRARPSLRGDLPFATLALLGTIISFLGAFYYYGLMLLAATQASQNTLEAMNGNAVWNQPRLNARLFLLWLDRSNEPAPWTPTQTWMWRRPDDAPPTKAVDLRPLCAPQSLLSRLWPAPRTPVSSALIAFFVSCLIIGPALLLASILMGCATDSSPGGSPGGSPPPAAGTLA